MSQYSFFGKAQCTLNFFLTSGNKLRVDTVRKSQRKMKKMQLGWDGGNSGDLKPCNIRFRYWSQKINILGMLWAQGITTGGALGSAVLHLDKDGLC